MPQFPSRNESRQIVFELFDELFPRDASTLKAALEFEAKRALTEEELRAIVSATRLFVAETRREQRRKRLEADKTRIDRMVAALTECVDKFEHELGMLEKSDIRADLAVALSGPGIPLPDPFPDLIATRNRLGYFLKTWADRYGKNRPPMAALKSFRRTLAKVFKAKGSPKRVVLALLAALSSDVEKAYCENRTPEALAKALQPGRTKA